MHQTSIISTSMERGGRKEALLIITPKASTNSWCALQSPLSVLTRSLLTIMRAQKCGSHLDFYSTKFNSVSDKRANVTCRCHIPGDTPCRVAANPCLKA